MKADNNPVILGCANLEDMIGQLQDNPLSHHLIEALLLHDHENCLVWVNPGGLTFLEKREKEVIGKPCYKVREQEPQDCEKCLFSLSLKTGTIQRGNLTCGGKTFFAKFIPVIRADGTVIGVLELAFNVYGINKLAHRLARDVKRFRELFDQSPNPVLLLNEKGIITDVNNSLLRNSGLSYEFFVGKRFSEFSYVDEETLQTVEVKFRRILKGSRLHPFEIKVNYKERSYWFELFPTLVQVGKEGLILVIMHNTTLLHRQMNDLKQALREKELLLREVHHRVKNNLQVITSLIRLHQRFLKDRTVSSLFEGIHSRIRAMAIVHEQLYRSSSLDRVDLRSYIQVLVRELRGMRFPDFHLDVNLELEEVSLDISRAIPCGVVLNELITNVINYAYPGQKTGKMDLRLKKEGSEIQIYVRDYGSGLPEEIDFSGESSLGLHLVKLLVEQQLTGRLEYGSERGAFFKATIPLE